MPNFYLAPAPFTAKCSQDGLTGWAREACQSGLSYLKLQPAYPYIDDAIKMINGDLGSGSVSTLSDVKSESTIRNLKELIAAQTNIRIIPSFKTEIGDFEHQQVLLNKLYMAWQSMTYADRSLRKAWQYAAGAGTGYIGMRWASNHWRRGKGDIVADAYGPLDVLPVGLPKSHKIKEAYAVAHKIQTPYHEAIRAHPLYADKIQPNGEDRQKNGVISEAVRLASAVLRRFGPGGGQEEEPTPWGTVDIYYIYIDDDTVNRTGSSILMGDPGTTWSYTVPTIGERMVAGADANGRPMYREAEEEDCRLFPTGRLLKCTDKVCLNPDFHYQVNPYWAGLPLVQLRADDWPWTFLGFPLTRAGQSIEKANNSIFRGMVDAMNARLSPGRVYDRNTLSDPLAQALDPRIPNQVVGLDLTFGGDQIKPLLPAEYYNVPVQFIEFMEKNDARIKYQMGVADATALSRARQLPSGDSTERLMEAMGPLIKDQSRNMESSVRDWGEIWKNMAFQFYSARRRMQVLGAEGLVEEDFEFKPGDLVPEDGIPGERPGMGYFDRARLHANNFSFVVTPYSLHELNSVTRKLFHLQLIRSGFPISWWTLAEVFDIKNFGPKPKKLNEDTGEMQEIESELELWISQKEMEVRFQAALQQSAGGAGGPGGGGAGGAPGKGAGRPPTGQNPPSIEQKGDGRPIIRESKK